MSKPETAKLDLSKPVRNPERMRPISHDIAMMALVIALSIIFTAIIAWGISNGQ